MSKWDRDNEFGTPGFDGISAPPSAKRAFDISAPPVDDYPSMPPAPAAAPPADDSLIEETYRLDQDAETALRALVWAEVGQQKPDSLQHATQIILATMKQWSKKNGIAIPDRSDWLVQSHAMTAAWRVMAWSPCEHPPGARRPEWTDNIDAVLSCR